jgi:hypothetical protein
MYKWKNIGYLSVPMVMLLLVLCSFVWQSERIKGNGEMKAESRQASSFRAISTSAVFKVYIQQGNTHSVKVEAESNLLPYIETEVKGNELDVRIKKGYNIRPTEDIKVYVTLKDLEKLSGSGAGGFYSQGRLKTDRLEVNLSGAVKTELDVQANDIEVSVSGASNVDLKGSAGKADYRISGTADIAAFDLQANDVHVGISGTAKANVNAAKSLMVNVSGMGTVKYKGSPNITQSVSGMGKISKEG